MVNPPIEPMPPAESMSVEGNNIQDSDLYWQTFLTSEIQKKQAIFHGFDRDTELELQPFPFLDIAPSTFSLHLQTVT